jgi:hypothetical protein
MRIIKKHLSYLNMNFEQRIHRHFKYQNEKFFISFLGF